MATATLSLTATVPPGWKYITVNTPDLSNTLAVAFSLSPTLATSDLIVFSKWYTSDGATTSYSVSISTNSIPSFGHISGSLSLSFLYFIWDDSTSDYGTTATYSINLSSTAAVSLLPVQDFFEWMYASGGTGGVMKRTKEYLKLQGFSGNTNTAMFKWLRSLGYTKSLTSMLDKFERDYTNQHGHD